MKTKFSPRLLLFVVFFLVLPIVSSLAQDLPTEKIKFFNSAIQIDRDASMTVTETITVFCAAREIRHGIYRDFPTRYKDRFGNHYRVDFAVEEVLRDGTREAYHLQSIVNGTRIYIGNKDSTLSPGTYTYTLAYTTNRKIGYFKDFDELYWNVTGNGWSFPIDNARATVTLPIKVSKENLRLDGFTGAAGAREKNFSVSVDMTGDVSFATTEGLLKGEGLTIVVAWPKGIVTEPALTQKLGFFLRDNRPAVTGLLGLLAILGYYLLVWYRVGRDPQKGVIIPLYDPPKGLSPAALRYIWKMAFDNKIFTCAIINMAVKGYLSIAEKKGIYTLRRSANTQDHDLSAEEKALSPILFSFGSEIVVESLNHEKIRSALHKTRETLKNTYEKSYFLTNKKYFVPGVVISASAVTLCALTHSWSALPILIFLSFWLTFWSLGVVALTIVVFSAWKDCAVNRAQDSALREAGLFIKALSISLFSVPFFAGELFGIVMLIHFGSLSVFIVLCAAIFLNCLFFYLLKAPTLLGRRIMDQIEGFKMYLGVAEKDRLNTLHSPRYAPELFERHLPYALALDVQQQWAQQFSSLLQGASENGTGYSPAWYRSTTSGFTAAAFVSALESSFSNSVSSASSPPGSSSGGGGGGSSGGGGGGGGGGGW